MSPVPAPDAASPTALNGAIKEACDAGITVVSFDGIVTEPCAWRVKVDFKKMGADEIAYLAGRLPDGGNLLEIRRFLNCFDFADEAFGLTLR